MTTSRNNTIMSWMAYTDFLSRLRIAAGILLPLNTRTLLLYPGGRDCIGAAGVDAYTVTDGLCTEKIADPPGLLVDGELAPEGIRLAVDLLPATVEITAVWPVQRAM